MARFFIDRPVFAWVIALFIMVMGAVSITQLPIAQYPNVAPPSIVVTAAYPGASAQTLEDSVISVIEREMNGSPGLIYMESISQANGTGTITLSFETGHQRRPGPGGRAKPPGPRHPAPAQAVVQQGVRVDKARSNFLLFTILSSDDPKWDPIALGDYASRTVLPEIQRIKGVGQAQLFGTEKAMRIWIDPAKLVGYNLSTADVNNAIRQQNAQVASGTIGDLPLDSGQTITATVVVTGQLSSVEQFGNIVLRANPDGSTVRLKDVARIEIGGQNYAHLGAPERQALHRYRRAIVAHRQCAGNGQAGPRPHGRAVALLPARHEVVDSFRQLALHRHFHQTGGRDPDRSRDPGVPRDVSVPAKLPLHHHPHHRGAGRPAGFASRPCLRWAFRSTC